MGENIDMGIDIAKGQDHTVYYISKENGETKKLQGFKSCELKIEEETHFANDREYSTQLEITLNKDQMKAFKKSLGINSISKKRFKKLLMAKGIQRNEANQIVKKIKQRLEIYT